MTKILSFSILLFLAATKNFAQESQQNLVKQTFNKYKSSILNDKGEEALKCIDSKTIKYYTDILLVVKNADSAKVNALSITDKITVFSIRHRATKEEILKMDGKGLFVYAIKSGMVSKSSVINNTIGNVTIDNQFAKGQLFVSGKKADFYFYFYKELNEWKLNLTSLFPLSNTIFNNMVKESGEDENEFLFTILENLYGTKPGAEIWQPIK